jgi:DnaK suppressor protein
MIDKHARFDHAYLENKRRQLIKLRAELLAAARDAQGEEEALRSDAAGEAHESEDEAQRLAMLEVDEAVAARDFARLARIDRALHKIQDGTYGLSDVTGEPIPAERLEAMPDAIDTVAEQESRRPLTQQRR